MPARPVVRLGKVRLQREACLYVKRTNVSQVLWNSDFIQIQTSLFQFQDLLYGYVPVRDSKILVIFVLFYFLCESEQYFHVHMISVCRVLSHNCVVKRVLSVLGLTLWMGFGTHVPWWRQNPPLPPSLTSSPIRKFGREQAHILVTSCSQWEQFGSHLISWLWSLRPGKICLTCSLYICLTLDRYLILY